MSQPNLEFHEILRAREQRWQKRQQLALQYQTTLATLGMNIPGPDKNLPGVEAAFNRLCKDWRQRITALETKIHHTVLLHSEIAQSADGPFWHGALSYPAQVVKELAIYFERDHPLGRLADLDIMDKHGTPVTRADLGYGPRLCFLCDQEATLCRRRKTHSPALLQAAVLALLQKAHTAPA